MIMQLLEFLKDLMEAGGYPGVVLAVLAETFITPIPSGAILPFAGFLAGEGKMSVPILIFITGFASYIGTLPFYYLGHIWDECKVLKITEKYGKFIFIDVDEVKAAFKMFDKYDRPLIFFGRLIPVVRSLISLPAGIARMKFWQFSLYTIGGACLWSSLLITGGYYMGREWEMVGEILDKYENVVYALVLLTVMGYVAYKIWNRKKKQITC